MLIALFAAGLGVVIGTLIQRIQPVIGPSIVGAIHRFFLAGGVGVLAFEPEWLQHFAAYIP